MAFSFFPAKTKKKNALTETLRNNYRTFQDLLAENNRTLTLMSELEQQWAGESPCDWNYIRSTVQGITAGVYKLVTNINTLSNKRYAHLFSVHEEISQRIWQELNTTTIIPVSPLTIDLRDLTRDSSLVAGHKNAHLGEICSQLQLPTPSGFAVSSHAFRVFMDQNGLRDAITLLLKELDVEDFAELASISLQIHEIIMRENLPDDLVQAIRQEVAAMFSPERSAAGSEIIRKVSVRSSALYEDGEFTFAGQYATFLNVIPEEIAVCYKRVVASLFSPRALYYSKSKGFADEDMVMSVGVMQMIEARAGGVMYTRNFDGAADDTVIINGVWGLGTLVVDGAATPHSFIVSKHDGSLVTMTIPDQEKMVVCDEDKGVVERQVPLSLRRVACLTGEQLRLLTAYGCALERHYATPQDIEWALDQEGRLVILQSRPLHFDAGDPVVSPLSPMLDNYPVLISGAAVACKGVACGKAFILREEEELRDFPDGAVLVAHHTSTKFITVMSRAAAIVTDVGSITGHMALLSREYGIPTLLETRIATQCIEEGMELTVDATRGIIYQGLVEELCADGRNVDLRRTLRKNTRQSRILEKTLKHIVPLNLLDPDSDNFRQECCLTMHDITRFIHEKAMAEIIFMSGRPQEINCFEDLMKAVTFSDAGDESLRSQASDLKIDIPMTTHVLDLDRGLQSNKGTVSVKDISSDPFHAFMRGLCSMKWPQSVPGQNEVLPRFLHALSAKGRGNKPESKSYAITASHYMNFNLKLGYHFSMVEAYASENINDNYIKYFFKGGGASPDRKLRRVRLIKELLKKMHFRVDVVDDVINAMLTKYRREDIEKCVEIMGKLTVYTKQLDMVMFNDAVTDMFIEDFIRDHLTGRGF